MNQEFNFVQRLVKKAPRSRKQINAFYMGDAEILQTDSGYLCATVDTISEEISLGLIQSPETLGWLAAMASLSDLAAVGVTPQKMSLTWVCPATRDQAYEAQLKKGVQTACNEMKVFWEEYQRIEGTQDLLTCTAACLVKEKPRLLRGPVAPGDFLYSTGPFGLGNATAFANVALRPKSSALADQIDQQYRPRARVAEGLFIREFASACLDTSDGGLFSFDLLGQLNSIGIEIHYSSALFHPLALQLAKQAQVHPFLFFAAQNGEFELLFAIPENRDPDFRKKSQSAGMHFLPVGRVKDQPGLTLQQRNQILPLDLTGIENMLQDRASAAEYILALLKFASSNKIEAE